MSRLVLGALLVFGVSCGTAGASPSMDGGAGAARVADASQAEVTLNAPGLL